VCYLTTARREEQKKKKEEVVIQLCAQSMATGASGRSLVIAVQVVMVVYTLEHGRVTTLLLQMVVRNVYCLTTLVTEKQKKMRVESVTFDCVQSMATGENGQTLATAAKLAVVVNTSEHVHVTTRLLHKVVRTVCCLTRVVIEE